MAQMSRPKRLFDKAEAALLSAVEIYNKPDFSYREEAFSILMLNAWELLLKAKLVSDNRNQLKCIYVYEKRVNKNKELSKRLYPKKNRAGNIETLGIWKTMLALDANSVTRLPSNVKSNISALVEIRDNAIHFFNSDTRLKKQILEIGTASVKNFIGLSKAWFAFDFSRYNLYLMPIGFISDPLPATAISTSSENGNLFSYLAELSNSSETVEGSDYHVSLEVKLAFKKSAIDPVFLVSSSNDPTATKVYLSEEDIRSRYPWDYGELLKRCRNKYSNFKANAKFHEIKEPLLVNEKYAKPRFLDPSNTEGTKKMFFNPNIMQEFDRHYVQKS